MRKLILACALCAFVGAAIIGGPAVARTAHHFIDGHHIKNGTVSFKKLSKGTQQLIKNGGKPGQNGSNGTNGAVGPQGPQGPKGDKGDKGNPGTDAPAPEYSVANVFVKRGTGSYVTWATYSSRMGSPVGDSTGGTFRFSCSTTNAPCDVAFSAGILSDSSTADGHVYPRLSITKEDFNSGAPLGECEYADGADNSGSTDVAPRQPSSTAASAFSTHLNMGIGGTLDCGSSQTYTPVVDHIEVPAGFYNVTSTFTFVG